MDKIIFVEVPSMNHSINVNGKTFWTAQVVDSYEKKTHDMTAIFMDRDDESPMIIDYYYGEPDEKTTAHYINEWFAARGVDAVFNSYLADICDIVNAYHLTNREYLDAENLDKVERALNFLNNTLRAVIGQ